MANFEANASDNAYKQAGVDIAAGNTLVEKIKPAIKKTQRSGSMGGLGGFGALFDLKAAGHFKDPLLVSATDGVGTKLKIAIETGIHDTVGIDLVAMCVNDLIVQGAEPLFFLDYFASGKLDVQTAQAVIEGIAKGCVEAGCALIGGETAEMPSMYEDKHYDLAGFTVGAVERDQLITGETINEGDIVIGLLSSGFHSNGFSLVRKIVENGFSYDQRPPFESEKNTLGEALLEPTRIYVKPILEALKTTHIKGLAHITGGGLLENIPRVLPKGLGVELDTSAWPIPPAMTWLKKEAKLSQHDFALTFNTGLGMAIICDKSDADALCTQLGGSIIGTVIAQNEVKLNNTDSAWS